MSACGPTPPPSPMSTLKKRCELRRPNDGAMACNELAACQAGDRGRHRGPADGGTPLAGSAVVTSGPTREAIDPVRYISNHSSEAGPCHRHALARLGAEVTLVSGPVASPTTGSHRPCRIGRPDAGGLLTRAPSISRCAPPRSPTGRRPSGAGSKIEKAGAARLELTPIRTSATFQARAEAAGAGRGCRDGKPGRQRHRCQKGCDWIVATTCGRRRHLRRRATPYLIRRRRRGLADPPRTMSHRGSRAASRSIGRPSRPRRRSESGRKRGNRGRAPSHGRDTAPGRATARPAPTFWPRSIGISSWALGGSCHRHFDYLPVLRPRFGRVRGWRQAASRWPTPRAPSMPTTGEVGVILINLGKEPFRITRGMRIAQLVVARHARAVWREVSELDRTARGAGGFGSTGVTVGSAKNA